MTLTAVIDTNIVLDMFIFNDERSRTLHQALKDQAVQWIATQVMRDELERVLSYTHLQPRMAVYQVTATDVLTQFDALVQPKDTAPKAPWVCKDPDDQKFIDLAVQHKSFLLSKDKAVLCMRKRLLSAGVNAQTAIKFIV